MALLISLACLSCFRHLLQLQVLAALRHTISLKELVNTLEPQNYILAVTLLHISSIRRSFHGSQRHSHHADISKFASIFRPQKYYQYVMPCLYPSSSPYPKSPVIYESCSTSFLHIVFYERQRAV